MMAEMCKVPGCADLACMQVFIDKTRLPMCFKHGRKAEETRPWIEEKLQERAADAECSYKHCNRKAHVRIHLFGEWSNYCDEHGEDMAVKVGILRGGQRPEVMPVNPLYRKPPPVKIEEIPPR
jgi:hypothetical protein